ncbi:MAG TPA: helix-turn-helix domain-containing protein [Conexibacter sp.]|nr:helix-turn-helix domain-containing protein [Conexibacter sp.]
MSVPADRAPWAATGERRPAGLVDAAVAAALLGVPRSWVLAQARAQRIPHVRLGRYVRFEPEELQAWWECRRRGPGLRKPRRTT